MALKPLVIPDDHLVDFIDERFRKDKPEERVRQSILKRLVNSLRYPKERIKVELPIKAASSKPRIDIAIFREGEALAQENIEIIVECKKESTGPADKKEGVLQLKSYMASCLNCEWGLWTNGKHREVWRKIVDEKGKMSFVEEVDIPSVEGIAGGGRKRSQLDRAVGDVLLYAFKSAHNHIHAVDGFQKEKAFFELLKVIFSKIWDEKNIPHPLNFYVHPSELNDLDGQQACKKRIESIFSKVKSKFPQIFSSAEQIDLNPRSLVRVVSELQNFTLINTDIDIKGQAYEEIVGSNLKGDRGQFFTPRNIMHMAVDIINPSLNERVLDPACGTGGFIVIAMLKALKRLEVDFSEMVGKRKSDWNVEERKQFDDKISEMVSTNYFGLDITPELVKASKMNMVMNNDGSGNMLQCDSLLPPYMWGLDFRKSFARALSSGATDSARHVKESELSSEKNLAHFDIIVTNPPFGSKIVIRDHAVLEQYDLGHIWDRPSSRGGAWRKTSRLQGGVPPEQLFIERCMQFLKPGGRMAIVVPDSILSSPGLGYIRQWLLAEGKIIASVDLHQDAFQPHTGVQTSILVIQKKTQKEKDQEEKRGALANYNIFMAIVEKVGHDKRGNTLYKRDEHGNDLLEEVCEEIEDESGQVRLEKRMEKIVDDQTQLVSEEFSKWKDDEGISW